MSIKSSLRLTLILMASLPLVFMTILTYSLSYNRYVDLAKNSASALAETYGEGFRAQLNIQIAEIEGLAHGSSIQNLLLESYNGLALGADSAYYPQVNELLSETSGYMNNTVSFYIYDVNGYFVTSSDSTTSGDWEEYMNIPVTSITETTIMKSSNINKNSTSIDLVTPVYIKGKIVGLIRENVSAAYFGSFIPDDGKAFIMTSSNDYLFSSTGLTKDSELEAQAQKLFTSGESNGYLYTDSSSVKNIYGYYVLPDFDWIYLIEQDGSHYQEILTTLPVTLVITLIIILTIAIWVSQILAHKYTDPIISLKKNMTEAAAGNLDLISDIHSNDEFGDLSDKFNTMMNIISSNYRELEASKRELEANEVELKKNYAHIEQLAYHDGLTGLYNRVAFMKYANEIFHKDGSRLNRHAIFFLDLDNFKNVNDTLGHDYGDMLLKQVSTKLASLISDKDILARTGGDEFLIMKPCISTNQELDNFAKHLVDSVRQPFNLDDEIAHVSLSVGISIFPSNGLTISELIKNADIAMYSAKTAGKNNYRFFNSYMEDDFNRRNDLSDILAHVIEKNEVYLQYQPQASVSTGKITGYEALMRIDSDLVGFISPSEFIPIAEENGLINQLGEWALIEACTFNQALMQSGYEPLKVSVNVSTAQLKDERLIEIVKSIPAKTGMDLKHLEIEITESVLMNSFEHNLKLINTFKELGISIALDDFGTGYSSFNYLTQIPIDTLKIDKSFIDGICNNEKDRCIADSIISLAHKMNISVVAEGVEDKAQLNILKEQFCDTLQGYLFSKPLDSQKFIELLDKDQNS